MYLLQHSLDLALSNEVGEVRKGDGVRGEGGGDRSV